MVTFTGGISPGYLNPVYAKQLGEAAYRGSAIGYVPKGYVPKTQSTTEPGTGLRTYQTVVDVASLPFQPWKAIPMWGELAETGTETIIEEAGFGGLLPQNGNGNGLFGDLKGVMGLGVIGIVGLAAVMLLWKK